MQYRLGAISTLSAQYASSFLGIFSPPPASKKTSLIHCYYMTNEQAFKRASCEGLLAVCMAPWYNSASIVLIQYIHHQYTPCILARCFKDCKNSRYRAGIGQKLRDKILTYFFTKIAFADFTNITLVGNLLVYYILLSRDLLYHNTLCCSALKGENK